MATTAAPVKQSRLRALGALTPSGRPIVPVAWSLYDFANTIFSFAVVSGAIGLWLTDDSRFGERDGNVYLSLAVVASVGLNAMVSPVLGALSDRGGRRMPFLLLFTLLCVVPTAFIGPSPAAVGIVLFVVANFGYQAALIYYDATLKSVSLPATRGRLSGIGVAVGYCGTIFAGLFMVALGVPVEARFTVAAILFAIFAVPIFAVVRETGPLLPKIAASDVLGAWSQLGTTVRHAREVPGLLRFLVGRFFYSDAVNTIIVVMTVVTTRAMGLSDREALLVLLGLTVVAVIASFGWGRLVDSLGPKRTLMIVLSSWAVGLVLGAVSLGIRGAPGLALFLVAGAILGSGLGGVQVADRVLMVRLAPPARLGEFFGLYGLVGKGSQVVGQLLYGATILVLFDSLGVGAYQFAVLSLLVTMLIGAWLLRPVSDRWAGSGEVIEPATPPERLAPMSAPIEPR
ncbi:MAG TPA: MFS transporter [Candidatus Limnocylindrales bacterium]|nr:MFS transporter [Candidatus Limnocylindrales bacterium]